MQRRTLLTVAAVAVIAACTPPASNEAPEQAAAPAGPDPAETVRPLYDRYLTEGATFPSLEEQAPWSASMLAALQAMMARSQAMGEPILDFDPLIDAQDYQLSNLNVATEAVAANSHAVVRASFTNSATPTEVIYDLAWENGGWRVDNIRTSRWDLRAIATG